MPGKPTKADASPANKAADSLKYKNNNNNNNNNNNMVAQNGLADNKKTTAITNNSLTLPFKSPRLENFDPDDPDYLKELRRPAVIKEDLHQMERSQRVKQILDSAAFREELEKLIIHEQRVTTGDLTNLKSLEQLSDIMLPNGQKQTSSGTVPRLHSGVIIPVADLRGVAGSNYSKEERIARNKFACLFRLMDLFRWNQGICSNHCSLRISDKHALTNPICLMNHEITAGQLLKVDLDDLSVVTFDEDQKAQASTSSVLSRPNFQIHAAIYKKRPDVNCIVFVTSSVVGAVAAMKCGLMPLSQEAIGLGQISCHDFQGYNFSDPREAGSIEHDLGPKNQIMLLRNNGFLLCTTSIEKANKMAYQLILACETQIRAIRAGVDNLVIPSEAAQKKTADLIGNVGGGGVNKVGSQPGSASTWKVGELEWEAWMRMLDNAGYRTGHLYRSNLCSSKSPATRLDIATPPCASSFYGFDSTDNVSSKAGQYKQDLERMRFMQQSPNYYHKDDRTSAESKKSAANTRWVPCSSASPGLQGPQPIRITTTPHQFLPPQTSPSISPNPKELKEKQRKIREQGRIDNISAGPQSKLLEGVSYQEAAALKHLQEMSNEGVTGEKILIGAASKGIVERDHRHNTQIFSQLYQSNPFASETVEVIQKYVDEVGQKSRSLVYQSSSGTYDRFDSNVSGGSASPESVSLMQAAREHNLSRSTGTPPPTRTVVTKETTFDVNDKVQVVAKDSRPKSAFSIHGSFRRSKSDRYNDRGASTLPKLHFDASPDIPEERERGGSENDTHTADSSSPQKKTKKKFHRPSFLKGKKDKEKGSK